MGYLLDNCPTLHVCCMSVPLRVAAISISLVGLVWSALYIFGYTGAGCDVQTDLGVPKNIVLKIKYVYGIFGLTLCAIHVLLFFAVVYESALLCEVYEWVMVIFWLAAVVCAVGLSVAMLLLDMIVYAIVSLLFVLITVLISFYFVIVVANYRMSLPL